MRPLPRRWSTFLIAPCVWLGLALHGTPGGGQSVEAPPAESGAPGSGATAGFFEAFEVNVVNVEVHVVDREGKPVRGLTREDFELFEDGDPVTITNFYAVEEGERLTRVGESPQPVVEAAPAVETVAAEQRLHLILYVDNFNLHPFHRNRVFRRVREFLRNSLGPGDRVSLVTYDRTFKERVPFTSDFSLISSQLFELEDHSGLATQYESERREVLEFVEEADSQLAALSRVKTFASSRYNDMSFTLSALKDYVVLLGGLPGRKAVVYVSDGLPMVTAEDLFQAVQERFPDSSTFLESRDFDLTRRYQELTAQANTGNVAFYTIDAGGLRVASSISVERRSVGTSSFIDATQIRNLQSALLLMAEETGGRAVINTNDVGEPLEEIGEELRTYYSLGYAPGHTGSGRFHRIEVKLREKERGLRVRHRAGYRDVGASARLAATTNASLIFGYEDNPLDVILEIGSGNPRGDGLFEVPIRVQLPLSKIVLVQQGTVYRSQVKLSVAAVDREGGQAEPQEIPVPIEIPAAQIDVAKTKRYEYVVALLMRGGDHRVAVGVVDELAGARSFLRRAVDVGGRG